VTASLFDSKVLVVAYTIPLCSPLAHTAHTSRRRVGCQLAAAPCDGRASSCWPSVSAQTHLNVLVSTAGIKVGRAGTCGALTLDLQDGVRGSGITGPSRPSPSGVTVSCDARGRGAAREDASIRDNEKKVQTRGAGRDPYVEKCYARRAGASERRSTQRTSMGMALTILYYYVINPVPSTVPKTAEEAASASTSNPRGAPDAARLSRPGSVHVAPRYRLPFAHC
jgi:hypothetical protein